MHQVRPHKVFVGYYNSPITGGFVWGAVVATRKPADIREVLASFEDRDIPKEFIERSKEYQK